MGRPRVYDEKRVTTAIRLPEWLHARLREIAYSRGTSVNHLMELAARSYLDRVPALDPQDEAAAI